MKAIILLMLLVVIPVVVLGQKFQTETTFNKNGEYGGISTQRFQLNHPSLNFKYDYKVNLKTGEKEDDVAGIFIPA